MTTNLFLLIHFGIFLMTICLALLLIKFNGAKVTVSYLIIWSAAPIANVFLLGLIVYELFLIFLDRRK